MWLEEESSKVTAIITPWGVHIFLACPFGISTEPGEYQTRMAPKVLKGFYLNGAVVYIDNTVIYKNERNIANVGFGFVQIRTSLMSDSANQCFFGMTSVEFSIRTYL